MNWSLNELEKQKKIEFDEVLAVSESLKQRSNDVLDASSFEVRGQIVYEDGLYLLDFILQGKLSLPSSRSLKPVDFPIDKTVNEVFSKENGIQESIEQTDSELIIPLQTETISLDESVIDNILLEIPLQILAKDEENDENFPTGKFWSVLSEEAYQKQQEEKRKNENSPFADLGKLFE